MKSLRQQFGERIRVLRKSRKWTQEDLGERAGLHYTYVGQVERGEPNLSIDNIEKLASGLGVTPADLFAFSERSGGGKGKIRMELDAILGTQQKDELERILRIVREIVEFKGS